MCGLPNVISEKACQRCNDSLLALRFALELLTLGHAPIRPNEQRLPTNSRTDTAKGSAARPCALRPPPSALARSAKTVLACASGSRRIQQGSPQKHPQSCVPFLTR
eukprot:s1564_g12.t1